MSVHFADLLKNPAPSENLQPSEPIVLSTRVRLARNLAGHQFPGWADVTQRATVRRTAETALRALDGFTKGWSMPVEELSALERQVLVERHLISRELTEAPEAEVIVSEEQRFAIMINEEDHLRIQAVRNGFHLTPTWEEMAALDESLEDHLDIAFSNELGFLTACPTNVGTGLRASAMLHLPGLVLQEHMERVVRMVNQLGMAVRGLYGEGSEATGSIFQISNQQTLGEAEEVIIKRLVNVLHAIIEQEKNARLVILENKSTKLFDKIGRAYGILQNGHLLSSGEAMNLLSLMRLAVDLQLLPSEYRQHVDRLFMESQPGHIQWRVQREIEPGERDNLRAQLVRDVFCAAPALDFSALQAADPTD